jgi:hypothetical protein
MDRKPSVIAIRVFAVVALIAVTFVPAVRSDDADGFNLGGQPSAAPSAAAPTIVAQGRCYNGRCF